MKNYFQIQFQVEKEKILVLSNVETVHVEDFGPKQPMPTAANVPVRSGSLNVRFFRDVWWWINPEFRAIFKNVKIFEIGAKFSLLAPLESQCWKRFRFAQCPVFSRCLMTNQSRISCHFQKGKNLWNWSEIQPASDKSHLLHIKRRYCSRHMLANSMLEKTFPPKSANALTH